MTRSEKTNRNHQAFFILVAIVLIGGLLLWSQGDLRSPIQSTVMLIGLSSGETGFAMVTEDRTPPQPAASSETGTSAETTNTTPVTGTMTLETLTAELAAAGVDVESVSAQMAAEGRSLDNLLTVVNSGRVTVAELATRLKGESTSETTQPTPEGSASLLDIRWEELGSVAYNLWIMLVATVLVIVVARPVGWLIHRIKWARPSAT